jgi:hypothetical protein
MGEKRINNNYNLKHFQDTKFGPHYLNKPEYKSLFLLRIQRTFSVIIVSDFRLDDWGSIPGRGKELFPRISVSKPALRPTRPPIQRVRGFFPGDKAWPVTAIWSRGQEWAGTISLYPLVHSWGSRDIFTSCQQLLRWFSNSSQNIKDVIRSAASHRHDTRGTIGGELQCVGSAKRGLLFVSSRTFFGEPKFKV